MTCRVAATRPFGELGTSDTLGHQYHLHFKVYQSGDQLLGVHAQAFCASYQASGSAIFMTER
jgi:hypothetical protein